MISIEILNRVINDVSVKDDNFEEIGKAFSAIGDAFGIAEVIATFVAPVTYCAKQDKSKEVIERKEKYVRIIKRRRQSKTCSVSYGSRRYSDTGFHECRNHCSN